MVPLSQGSQFLLEQAPGMDWEGGTVLKSQRQSRMEMATPLAVQTIPEHPLSPPDPPALGREQAQKCHKKG